MLLKDIIYKGIETISATYPEGEAREMVFAYMEAVVGTKRHTHILEPEYSLAEDKTEQVIADFNRMAAGEPMQYVVGRAWFYGREFNVSPSVLIPRGETELLVNEILKSLNISERPKQVNVLDLCTGSGCIAWSLALENPKSKVTAVDISDGALAVASTQDFSHEMSRTGASAPTFVKADVLQSPADSGYDFLQNGKYDIIVSNPPYVMDSEKFQMRANVLDHEPHLALFVPDQDPLIFYRAVARWASELLSDNGVGMVEINEALGQETAELFRNAGFSHAEVVKDLHEKDRFVLFSY